MNKAKKKMPRIIQHKKRGKCATIQECRTKIYSSKHKLPATFDELQHCVADKDCIVFQSDVNWEGHFTTHSEAWLNKDWYVEDADLVLPVKKTEEMKEEAEEVDLDDVIRQEMDDGNNDDRKLSYEHPKRAKTIECFDSQRYEPYIVIPWCPYTTYQTINGEKVLNDETTTDHKLHTNPNISKNTHTQSIIPISPYYDERFHGYGKNKIQQISHLRIKGYNFHVLPEGGFVLHHPHPESNVKQRWNDGKHYKLHKEMDALYPKYLEELTDLYRDGLKSRGMIPPCGRK